MENDCDFDADNCFFSGRMHDRIDEIVKKVESEEAAKTRKD